MITLEKERRSALESGKKLVNVLNAKVAKSKMEKGGEGEEEERDGIVKAIREKLES